MQSDPRHWIATLRQSHNRLASLAQPLDADQVSGPSYCSDWTIAQVLSHIGSGAEIALLMLPDALGEGEPAGQEAFPAIWDRWNAKSPAEQLTDGLASDEQHVSRLEQLTDAQLAKIHLSFYGMELDAVGLVRLRLGEHALHTWDVAVIADPAATVSPDAVDLLVDNVAQLLAPRLGKPQEEPLVLRIRTTEPERDYLFSAGESVSMTDLRVDGAELPGSAVHEVRMPSEALLRLAYGRLDAGHTPAEVEADPGDLEQLRKVFPGF
ncbi:MAG: maleylpyruvate isomerase family mycothiol-dependent enzyme [Actinomycetota bacterium]